MYEKYFDKLREECLIRNRSARTAETYISNIKVFMRWTGNKPMEELTLQDAREFILYKRKSRVKASTCNFYNSSICFLYKHVLHITWDQDMVPRMRLDTKLPEVLSLEEVEKLIDTATDIRNKAIIALLYSSGLRVGELVKLRAKDIYISRMQVYIPESKNHSDRWTILSQKALDLLTEYWRSYPVPREYFFVSLDEPHNCLKVSGVEIMLRNIGKEAGLSVHPHTLRHSFASHMIEQGVPISYVQSMLGHRCLESTQVYIHISNKTVMGIKSPLDHPQKKKRGRKPKKKDGDANE
jgi:site-specific recombinase XerD